MCTEQSGAGHEKTRKNSHPKKRAALKECRSHPAYDGSHSVCKISLAYWNLPGRATSIRFSCNCRERGNLDPKNRPRFRWRVQIKAMNLSISRDPSACIHVCTCDHVTQYKCELVWNNNWAQPPNYIIQCSVLHKRSRV